MRCYVMWGDVLRMVCNVSFIVRIDIYGVICCLFLVFFMRRLTLVSLYGSIVSSCDHSTSWMRWLYIHVYCPVIYHDALLLDWSVFVLWCKVWEVSMQSGIAVSLVGYALYITFIFYMLHCVHRCSPNPSSLCSLDEALQITKNLPNIPPLSRQSSYSIPAEQLMNRYVTRKAFPFIMTNRLENGSRTIVKQDW